jgi:alpha-ribazole phosphatase
MRLFVLSRHAESILNHEKRINGDPSRPAPLTERGREEAALLGLQIRSIPLDACLHTRFGRTLDTARIAIEGREVLLAEDELFDDVRVGELEGWTLEEYRAWKREHVKADRFPGGESLDEAARRYAEGFRRLLAGPYGCVLPRDPDPVRAQCGRRLRRSRRAGARNPERGPVPLRRGSAGGGRGRHRATLYGSVRNSFAALTWRPGCGPPAIA